MNASDHFSEYRRNPDYPARPPARPCAHPDEAEDLSIRSEVMSLPEAEANAGVEHCTVTEEDTGGFWLTKATIKGEYLWVVRPDDVKVALEYGVLGQTRAGGGLKHTNPVRGNAHCGGELWFENDRAIYLNGSSGRFPPRGSDELDAIVAALKSAGYGVCSFGWNHEAGKPRISLRKADILWL
jgi:hypothetical protein